MSLKETVFNHHEDDFRKAIGVSKEVSILCRERIFFAHFAHSLQADELFPSRDEAPKEYKTVTGDLQVVLRMISDPMEYDYTLLNFMPYHRLAQEAYSRYHDIKDGDNNDDDLEELSKEERLKLELVKLVTKLHALKENRDDEEEEQSDDEDDGHYSITLKKIIKRIKLVKDSKYNFHKYMTALGFPISRDYSDVDNLLNDLFK